MATSIREMQIKENLQLNNFTPYPLSYGYRPFSFGFHQPYQFQSHPFGHR